MKQVLTNVWCDVHLNRAASEEVHAMSVVIAIDDDGPVSVDMCAECVTEFIDPLRKLMATYGEPAEPAAPKKRTRRQAAATPAPEPKASKSSTKSSRKAKKTEPTAAQIRAWALENGYVVPDRGRIPQDVREAFIASGGKA
jgi:hypothetical protein